MLYHALPIGWTLFFTNIFLNARKVSTRCLPWLDQVFWWTDEQFTIVPWSSKCKGDLCDFRFLSLCFLSNISGSYNCAQEQQLVLSRCPILRFPFSVMPVSITTISLIFSLFSLRSFQLAIKADTHEGFCSRSMRQGHAPGAKLLRVYQRFHGYTSSSGAEFPPRKMLHDI